MSRQSASFGLLSAALAIIIVSHLGPSDIAAQQPAGKSSASEKIDADKPVSVEVARDRAKLLQSVYASTLDVMHHRYFRSDHAVLPARAMEDIFADIEKQSNIKARWIAVNTPAMSINHEPDGAFEKKAAGEIAGGKSDYEQVEGGVYQRATAIPLKSGCVSCHTKTFTGSDKTPRFAALVIRIPVQR
jgi:hypothetical protein